MKRIEVTLYEFAELSNEVQKKVLEDNRYLNVNGVDWWDFVTLDFTTICDTLGIQVADGKIYFSGFYSQGSGSAFDADIDLPAFIDGLKKRAWKEYAPKLEFNIVPPTTDRRVLALIKAGTINFSAYTQSSRHANYTRLHAAYDFPEQAGRKYTNIQAQLVELENWLANALDTINAFLFQSLQDSYEYEISDEAIREVLEGNEDVFTEDGHEANYLLDVAN